MEALHPGFRNRASIVLHRHATDPEEQNRLEEIATFDVVQTRDEIKVLRKGRRNTPALFGSGSSMRFRTGSCARLRSDPSPTFPRSRDGSARCPTAGLADSAGRVKSRPSTTSSGPPVRNQLGLEVPGHHQVSLASAEEYDPSTLKLDMDQEQSGC